MRSIYGVLSAFGLLLLFTFQNCAQTGPQSTDLSSHTSTQKSPPVALAASEIYVDQRLAAHQTHSDPANFDVQMITLIEFGIDRGGSYRFALDLASGILHDNAWNTDQDLDPDKIDEILAAVTGATLSNRHLLSSQEIYCTMEYTPGYARITTDRATFVLGEGSASCPSEDLYIHSDNAALEPSDLPKILAKLGPN